MPDVTERDGRHFVALYTGPSHVLLGLAFGKRDGAAQKLTKQPAVGKCNHCELDERQIVNAVTEGVASATQEAGSSLYVSEIVYVENDSPRYDMFRRCAYLIAKHVLAERGPRSRYAE